MNRVILMGRLTRDPELREVSAGVVANFSIAVDRPYTPRDGVRHADFISCVGWRHTAEFISRYFRKGSMIAVEGRIQTRSWQEPSGKTRYATDVLVEQAHFTGSKSESGDWNTVPQGNSYTQPQAGKDEKMQEMYELGYSDIDGSEEDLPF